MSAFDDYSSLIVRHSLWHLNITTMKKKEPVSTIMTKVIHKVQIDDKLSHALELVRKYGVRHVPVIQDKQLVGIISKTALNRIQQYV